MGTDDRLMKSVRERTRGLCETYDLEEFLAFLKRRGLDKVEQSLERYIEDGWIVPLLISHKQRFHRGHLLILLRLVRSSVMPFEAGIMSHYDFEDIVLRRAMVCEQEIEDVRDDASRVHQLFIWLWGEDILSFGIGDAVHSKALIDLTLDELDPHGFYETLKVDDDGYGMYRIIQDLIAMQSEIGTLVAMASGAGADIPNVQYLFDRDKRRKHVKSLLLPLESPFLTTPTRDMMAEERSEFMRARNRLLIEDQYSALVDLYDSHVHLFDTEVERHASLCVCLGHIYGDLLKDSERAAEAFQEALEYDSGHREAFGEVSRHLRESGHWRDLVELLSNHWDGVEDVTKRCAMILEAAQIEAFRLHNVDEAIGLFERCMLEGMPGHVFDDLHKIVFGLMEEATDNQKLRVLVILTTHIVSYAQCDKVTKLQAQFDTSKDSLVRCLSMLVDAGVESFRGDQPRALELVREALVLCPDNRLADGILLRIVPKLNAFSEFSEVMNDLESESISAEDLSGVWLRIAKVLLRVPNRESEALDYAERAVLTNENNDEGVALCLSIAQRIKCLDRAFVYASLAAAREKQDKARSDMEALCADLKLALGDDEDALVSVYESFLQFTDLREEVSDGLCELISGMSDDKAIALLQRVEARCVTNGMADLVSGLYESVLEREISQSLKKGLLERYIGFLMGQGSAISRDVFLSALAQLYALSPTERLFGMLKTFVGDNTDEVLLWAGYLEDDLDMADTGQLARIYTTLADCYQNILKDYEKAAAAFGKLLEVAPDNVAAFKCCFASYERLERYFECTELCQKFPLDRLTSAERVAYCQKSLIYALIYLYNAQVMAYFLEALCREGVELIPGVVEFMVEKAHQASVGNDQLVCFFEAIEAGAEGVLLLALRVARAGCLVREGRGEDALAVLDASTAALVKAHRGVFDYSQSIRALVEQLKGVPGESEALKLWSEAGADVVPPLTPPRGLSLDAIVERCAENPDDEGCANAVDDALKSLSPDEATSLCIRLGALYEQHQRLAAAEGYYKRAFGYTQSFELLEFYKRQRQFRKALKIMQFKLAKSVSSEVKVAVKLDMVLAYEQLRDVGNALKNLDELLEEGREAFEKSVWVALLRRRGALLTSSGDLPGAIEALKQASAQADAKAREEIDVDTCFLMREEKLLVEAKKLWQTLVLRGVKGDRMQLLNACYDVDAEKYADAEAKLVRLLEGVRGTPMEVLVLEQQLRLEQAQGADVEACRATARRILDLDSANALAKAVLS